MKKLLYRAVPLENLLEWAQHMELVRRVGLCPDSELDMAIYRLLIWLEDRGFPHATYVRNPEWAMALVARDHHHYQHMLEAYQKNRFTPYRRLLTVALFVDLEDFQNVPYFMPGDELTLKFKIFEPSSC